MRLSYFSVVDRIIDHHDDNFPDNRIWMCWGFHEGNTLRAMLGGPNKRGAYKFHVLSSITLLFGEGGKGLS